MQKKKQINKHTTSAKRHLNRDHTAIDQSNARTQARAAVICWLWFETRHYNLSVVIDGRLPTCLLPDMYMVTIYKTGWLLIQVERFIGWICIFMTHIFGRRTNIHTWLDRGWVIRDKNSASLFCGWTWVNTSCLWIYEHIIFITD